MGLECAIPGAITLVFYSALVVLPTGSFCILTYLVTFLMRIAHLIMILLCPMKLIWLKKRWQSLPKDDYEHYADEFDF